MGAVTAATYGFLNTTDCFPDGRNCPQIARLYAPLADRLSVDYFVVVTKGP